MSTPIRVRDISGVTSTLDIDNPADRLNARRILWRGGEVLPENQGDSRYRTLFNQLIREGQPDPTYAFRRSSGTYSYLNLGDDEQRTDARRIVDQGGELLQPSSRSPQEVISRAQTAKDELLQENSNQALEPSQNKDRDDLLTDLGKTEQEFGADTGGEVLNWPEDERSAATDKLEKLSVDEIIDGELLEPSESDRFTFTYKNMKGETREWRFSLMPAIDNTIPNPKGPVAKVPEAKPGLMVNTVMKHKNVVIPGGLPVVQTIGPEMIILQLVGAFIGTEGIEGTSGYTFDDRNVPALDQQASIPKGEEAMYGTWGSYRQDIEQLDSYAKARQFNTEVVLQGAPVVLQVLSAKDNSSGGEKKPLAFIYRGTISSFKIYVVRKDRTYWAINFLVTEYGVENEYKGVLEEDRGKAKAAAEEAAKKAAEEANSEEPEGSGDSADKENTDEGDESKAGSESTQEGETTQPTQIQKTQDSQEDQIGPSSPTARTPFVAPSLADTESSNSHRATFGELTP